MHSAIFLDLGSGIDCYPTQIGNEKVCVLSSRAAEDRVIQGRVRQFMKDCGEDCGTCGACPVSKAS